MRMGGHVHGQAVHRGGEVRAVVEIEATQKILIGLAIARVLRDHEAGYGFQHFAGPQQWPALQHFCAHHAL